MSIPVFVEDGIEVGILVEKLPTSLECLVDLLLVIEIDDSNHIGNLSQTR